MSSYQGDVEANCAMARKSGFEGQVRAYKESVTVAGPAEARVAGVSGLEARPASGTTLASVRHHGVSGH